MGSQAFGLGFSGHQRHWISKLPSSEQIMEAFKGKFTRTSAENFEQFLKALDVNMILRKAATVSTPVMEITEAGGVWSIKTSTTLKSMDLKFKLGEEFDETTPDGRQTRALINLEGGKIVCTQTAKKSTEKSTRSVRELNGPDELIYTMTIDEADGITCVQKFKRIA